MDMGAYQGIGYSMWETGVGINVDFTSAVFSRMIMRSSV